MQKLHQVAKQMQLHAQERLASPVVTTTLDQRRKVFEVLFLDRAIEARFGVIMTLAQRLHT